MRVEEARTVRVTARLQSGVALPAWFPAPLDGVLASVARRRRLGDAYGEPPVTPPRHLLEADPHGTRIPEVVAYRRYFKVDDLPLVKLRSWRRPDGGWATPGSQWVWAATCATWGAADRDVRWHHKRFDSEPAERVVGHLPANTDVGALKAWRIPTVVTVTGAVHWVVVGDPDRVLDLLGDVVAIGDGTARGEGRVLEWVVDELGPADVTAVHWHADGTVARPFPARVAGLLGVPDADLVTVDAVRPPYWRPPLDPSGSHRPQRQVVAPWTVRPL